MTGPTDAPPPEDDGGADDELREFLDSEYFAEMSDDMLLDEVSRGDDHRTISDDMPDEEWELQDKLHDWRDDVEDVPLPPKLDPEAIIAEHLRHTNPAEPPGPRSTSEGNTPKMSVQDESDKIRGLASSEDIPIERLHDAADRMKNLHAQARELVGPNSQHLGDLDGLAQMVADALETAIGAAKQYENKLHDAADAHARG